MERKEKRKRNVETKIKEEETEKKETIFTFFSFRLLSIATVSPYLPFSLSFLFPLILFFALPSTSLPHSALSALLNPSSSSPSVLPVLLPTFSLLLFLSFNPFLASHLPSLSLTQPSLLSLNHSSPSSLFLPFPLRTFSLPSILPLILFFAFPSPSLLFLSLL